MTGDSLLEQRLVIASRHSRKENNCRGNRGVPVMGERLKEKEKEREKEKEGEVGKGEPATTNNHSFRMSP